MTSNSSPCGILLIGLASVLLSRNLAADSFSELSRYYSSNLTDPCSILEDFQSGGGGYGAFEVNPDFGLELKSQAPDSYGGVRVLKAGLPASHSWQVIVKANVKINNIANNQQNPWFSAGLGIAKLGKNCDNSPSILATAPNRWSLGLVYSYDSDYVNNQFEHSISSYRRSNGELLADELSPLSGSPQDSTVLLRFRYSAADMVLSAAYSTNGSDFMPLPSGSSANLGEEWGLLPDDELIVYLDADSTPYTETPNDTDWISQYDNTDPYTGQKTPQLTSVAEGEIYLRDFEIGFVHSPSNLFVHSLNLQTGEIQIDDYSGNLSNVSVPAEIDGYPVTAVGPEAFFGQQNLESVVLPASIKSIGSSAFANCPNLTAVSIPPTLSAIGMGAFSGSKKLKSIYLPWSLILQGQMAGLENPSAYQQIVQSVGASLAENELFLISLASSEKFLALLTAKLFSRNGTYGLATQGDLSGYATVDQINTAFAAGQAEVVGNPNKWLLYTKEQISGMSIGNLTLTRQENGSFVLNYDIEQSNDLVNWTIFRNYGEELTGLPVDKKFIRIRVKQ